MVLYAVEAARMLTDLPPVLVVGHGMEAVRVAVGDGVSYVVQAEQRGTGHAMQQAGPLLHGKTGQVVVLYADMPLLRVDTLRQLIDRQAENRGPLTMLTLHSDDSRGFGRVVRGADGAVLRVVEEAAATPEERAIRELNGGVYCFDATWLWRHIGQIVPTPPKQELYLTDLVEMAAVEGGRVGAIVVDDGRELLGINTRVHLAEAEAVLRERINRRWMESGVTMVDPRSTFVEWGVAIGQDTVIWPNTFLRGGTTVGSDCEIGPNSVIVDSTIGEHCRIVASVVEGAVMEAGSDVGPFSHLRRGARLEAGAHVGNFGEVKNSTLGAGAKMGHFSYLGDAEVGAGANIGAGTITCNYDGQRKHPTVIGEGAFVGSDTMLVAPVRVGKGARTGAGSVVTHDVPDGAVAYGVPARVQKTESTGHQE